MADPRDLDDETVLALTIFGEARGEKRAGRDAVANVILNRTMLRSNGVGPASWGRSVKDVCLAKLQFSTWNADDPNRAKLLAGTDAMAAVERAVYFECKDIAQAALLGTLKDNTKEADHYLVTSIASRTKWARGKTPVAVIGAHSFYKFYQLPESPAHGPPRVAPARSARAEADDSPSSGERSTLSPPADRSGHSRPDANGLQQSANSAGASGSAGTGAPATFRQPDVEPVAADETVRPWWVSKRLKAGATLAAGSQVPGWIDTLWEKASEWFANDPDAVNTLWSHAVTLLAVKWVGYAIFAGGAAWLAWTFFYDRKQKG